MSTPNYARLVSQGRVKAYGVPWSDAEMTALLEITKHYSYPTWVEAAAYVRRGARTIEDVEEIRKKDALFLEANGNVPVEAMSREELEARVRDLDPGTMITNQAPDDVLREEVKSLEKKAAKGGKKKVV